MKMMHAPIIIALCIVSAMPLWCQSPVYRTFSPVTGVRAGSVPPGSMTAGAPAQFPFEYRSIDGVANNPNSFFLGSAGTPFLRLMAPDYGDGISTPAGASRPSPRAVSNAVAAQAQPLMNQLNASDFVWQWGQFLDHDVTETPLADPLEPFDFAVPQSDPWFDPLGTGTAMIAFERSTYTMASGVREQTNHITAFIDGSNVYGSDPARGMALRTLDGTGRMRTSAGDNLPYNTSGFPNAPSNAPNFFLAGDVRANEQVGLIALHTLFVREHNYWADLIGIAAPALSGDEIYLIARAVVGAELQAITYREWLPVVLGPSALPAYTGYYPAVDPRISNEFAAAAYRFGHSMLSETLLRLDVNGNEHSSGHLPLADAFFDPTEYLASGAEPILRGLATQVAQRVDLFVVDGVRSFLFGNPAAGGFDLAALNIQRGRDHGIPSFAVLRQSLGMPPVNSFFDLTTNLQEQLRLTLAYSSVAEVDAWVGLLCEPPVAGALVGPTLSRILKDQFLNLRNGDRFWYEAYLPTSAVNYINSQTLTTIIRRNTAIEMEIDHDIFHAGP